MRAAGGNDRCRGLRWGVVALALAASACHGCRGDHPYVPYSIGSAAPSPPLSIQESLSAGPAPSIDAAAAAEEPPVLAPPGLSRWQVQGVVLDATQGTVFASALVRDFDGDGASDAFAIVRPPGGNDPGQLVYYRGQPGVVALAPAAAFAPAGGLARDASCAPVDRLVFAGERSVLVELGAVCPSATTRAPDRYVAVVRVAHDPSLSLAATVFDPPGSPALSVDADVSDRDGDGRPDVALRVSLEGGGAPFEPGPRVSATLAWLDRPAGLGHDAAATESSFRSLAALASAHAVRIRDASSVPLLVAQTRALWRAVCADGAMPRLVGVQGTGAIACGVGRDLEELGLAEVRAYVTLGDPLRAALALDRAQSPPASHTASHASDAQGWIAQLAPVAMARPVREVAAVPIVARGHEIAWGALAFEPSGQLLVRTRAGLVRVDPDAGDETAADAGADWKGGVTSPDAAMRWIEVYDACDGVALRATFASGDDLRDVSLPVSPPLGNRCVGSHGAPGHALPIAWGPQGLEALVEGEPVLVSTDLAHASVLATLLEQPARGGPRSPDGKTIVVATGVGLFVRSAGHARLYRAPGFEGTYGQQRDCAVSNDAAHVACVHSGRAWVGSWDF
jgi:hypothetical protein